MPSSFSSKPGYYDDADTSTADNGAAPKANALGASLDKKKPPQPNDASKGFVFMLYSNLSGVFAARPKPAFHTKQPNQH